MDGTAHRGVRQFRLTEGDARSGIFSEVGQSALHIRFYDIIEVSEKGILEEYAGSFLFLPIMPHSRKVYFRSQGGVHTCFRMKSSGTRKTLPS